MSDQYIRYPTAIGTGTGNVTGPGSSTDNAVARFDGTTGKIIQNSGVIVDDSNNVTGVVNLTTTGTTGLGGTTSASFVVVAGNTSSSLLAGTTQIALEGDNLASSAATSEVGGIGGRVRTANSSFTTGLAYAVTALTAVKGAASTITRLCAYFINTPTAGTNNASITDNNTFTGNWFINSTNTNPSQFSGLVGVVQSTNNVTDALPTQAEMVTALGAANQGTGLMGVIKDANADTNFFICISNGTSWYALKMTKGA